MAAKDEIVRLKENLFPGARAQELEMHAHEIWNNRAPFGTADRSLTLEDKKRIFDRAIDVACSSDIGLIGIAIDKGSGTGMGNKTWPLERSWIDMVKAFKRYLSPRRGAEYGLIIADASADASERLVSKTVYETVRRYGTGRARSPIFDGVFFRDSRTESIIQLADMAAYVMHKHMKGDSFFADWHGRLEHGAYHVA